MTVETAVETATEQPNATEASETIQAAYDRIANPGKTQDEPKEAIVPTAETPPEPVISSDEVKALKAQVARIPELEKRLRDEGGRYGALKQSLEQIQQRIADKQEASGGAAPNVDELLAEIKQTFGEDELYTGLKAAFSKLGAARSVDPDAVSQIVAQQIQQAKQAEHQAAVAQLTEAHPTWMEDRETPEFSEWRDSLPARERDKFNRSTDPDYVSEKLDDFKEWKAKRSAAKPAEDEHKPEPKTETKPAPSKRLTSAVLPTNGAKPKAVGDDKQSQIRAAYERVAGNRR